MSHRVLNGVTWRWLASSLLEAVAHMTHGGMRGEHYLLGLDKWNNTRHSGTMSDSESDDLTEFARYFVRPGNATHRQYEALRAYFVEALPSHEVARRFGYTAGSFRVLCHQFRAQPERAFFLPPAKGPKSAPKTDPVRDQVIALRKQNLSIYDISRVLAQSGCTLSAATVAQLLKAEGFARLPRRRDDERPEHPHCLLYTSPSPRD